MNGNKKVKLCDILGALKKLPRTVAILKSVDKRLLRTIMFLSICTGVFPIFTLLISQELLNGLVLEGELKNILILLLVYVGVSIASDVISNFYSYVQSLYQYKLQYGLQHMIIGRCSRLNLRDFENAQTYNRIEKISSEIGFRPYQTFAAVTSIISSVVTMFSSMLLIVSWNPLMALILLAIPTASLLYYLKIGQQEFDMAWNRANDERKLWYLNHLLTHDFSYKEMKVLGIGKYLLQKYKSISDNFQKQNRVILRKKTVFDIIYGVAVQLIGGVIICVGLTSAFVGRILLGSVVSIIRAITMVQSNSRSIMMRIYAIYSNSLYMEMLDLFLNDTEEADATDKVRMLGDIKEIELKNLSFSYNPNYNALSNISLHFTAGKKYAIVGPNGSGKSTMLKILSGLYKPNSGELLVNGIPMNNIDMRAYYEKLSVMFQDFVKYEFTLRENVGFGEHKSIEDTERILSTLETVRSDFLKDASGRIDPNMQLGNWFENGRNLSHGQWQKIALARAYFKDASCYILDEPNSALDTVAEKEVFERFFTISSQHIGIYISHRLSAAKMADEIIVMDRGCVVAVGKHDELLSECDIYKKLYEAENYEGI